MKKAGKMAKPVKGVMVRMTGEFLVDFLGLPDDSKILKIIPSRDRAYCYDVLISTETGYELCEGQDFPIVTRWNREKILKE